MCTNFQMKKASDGSVVVGRSMEFPPMIPWSLSVLPAGYRGTGSTSAGAHTSKTWTATHGVVGICGLDNPQFHVDGTRVVANPTGVGTNAPYLDWHLTNLNNYVGLQATEPPEADVLGVKLAQFGQGGGLMGLPGDYTGPARFVRAAAMVAMSPEPADGAAAELQTMHILNSFDIPAGIISENAPDGSHTSEITDWITISNLTQGRYTYRTSGDPRLYAIDIKSVDFDKGPRSVPFTTEAPTIPVSL